MISKPNWLINRASKWKSPPVSSFISHPRPRSNTEIITRQWRIATIVERKRVSGIRVYLKNYFGLDLRRRATRRHVRTWCPSWSLVCVVCIRVHHFWNRSLIDQRRKVDWKNSNTRDVTEGALLAPGELSFRVHFFASEHTFSESMNYSMETISNLIDKIRKNSLTQASNTGIATRHSMSTTSPPYHNRYLTTHDTDTSDNVSRHFLTNGWANADAHGGNRGGRGSGGAGGLGVPLNEHEFGSSVDRSKVRRATQVIMFYHDFKLCSALFFRQLSPWPSTNNHTKRYCSRCHWQLVRVMMINLSSMLGSVCVCSKNIPLYYQVRKNMFPMFATSHAENEGVVGHGVKRATQVTLETWWFWVAVCKHHWHCRCSRFTVTHDALLNVTLN